MTQRINYQSRMRIQICPFQSHAVSIFMLRKVRVQKDVPKTWVPTTCSGDSNVGHNENTYKLVPVQVSKATYQGIVICCLTESLQGAQKQGVSHHSLGLQRRKWNSEKVTCAEPHSRVRQSWDPTLGVFCKRHQSLSTQDVGSRVRLSGLHSSVPPLTHMLPGQMELHF